MSLVLNFDLKVNCTIFVQPAAAGLRLIWTKIEDLRSNKTNHSVFVYAPFLVAPFRAQELPFDE